MATPRISYAAMEAQAIAPAMYEWNDATFPACIAVAGALASITTDKDFNEAALAFACANESSYSKNKSRIGVTPGIML
ncbi:MAG: hypothetical protein A3F13_05100 [Gammaproteobacteria bacterium RIFCSPHIGHO2_12_FULL_40_19]|nr:MAG: hypothetical protein A3F13_05100 [Gammaproteobacteria bacterium RIFCSPHIGHO2_12_FULL_40_19]